MYGKVIAASGGAYLLSFETSILPGTAGWAVLFVAGSVVVMDINSGGPPRRLRNFLRACDRRIRDEMSWRRRMSEIRSAAAEELELNCGIQMAEELEPGDRQWLREQAALAVQKFDGEPA